MQAIYSKNSLGSFFDIKDFVMGVCLSTVTTFVQQPFPISRNKKDEDLSEIKYFNNSNSKNIDKVIEMIYTRSAIEETVRKASPYKVEKIKQSTLDLKQDELIIIDVYTNSDCKDDFVLFEAEGNVLNELPDNYYICYF